MDRRDDRRRKPADPDRPDDAERESSFWLPAFAVLPLVLIGLASAAHVVRSDADRPIVGDMIVFSPSQPPREGFRIAVPATRVDPAPDTPSHCRLDSGVMARTGGSLVVERRLGTDPGWFRVHWAGAMTDDQGRDCGQAASVDVTRVDLRKLATAVGGFGARPL